MDKDKQDIRVLKAKGFSHQAAVNVVRNRKQQPSVSSAAPPPPLPPQGPDPKWIPSTFWYHVGALRQDFSYGREGSLVGAANIGVVQRLLTKLKEKGYEDLELELAVMKVALYHEQVVGGFTPAERHLVARQQIGGELLTDKEGEVLERAEDRELGTAIDLTEAKRLVDLIRTRCRSWRS